MVKKHINLTYHFSWFIVLGILSTALFIVFHKQYDGCYSIYFLQSSWNVALLITTWMAWAIYLISLPVRAYRIKRSKKNKVDNNDCDCDGDCDEGSCSY